MSTIFSRGIMFDPGRWSRRKFAALTDVQQHKKLADGLRLLYGAALQGPLDQALLQRYQELCQLVGLPALPDGSLQNLADRYHEHLKLAGRHLKEHNLLPIAQGDRKEPAAPLSIHIYLDHIRSAHNIGSIIRTCEAFSFAKIYFSADMAAATHKQVRDAAMGTVDWIAWQHITDVKTLPRPIIALETAPKALPLYGYPFPKECTLALGNEEYGCSPALLKECDAIVQIPLCGRKNSLNVANAFAIAAAEIDRQQRHAIDPSC
jgi:tRNA G18 (ribose-2'-O)-methylase SpoU